MHCPVSIDLLTPRIKVGNQTFVSFEEDLEEVKRELGLACSCPGKMGVRSLGIGEKCQKCEDVNGINIL